MSQEAYTTTLKSENLFTTSYIKNKIDLELYENLSIKSNDFAIDLIGYGEVWRRNHVHLINPGIFNLPSRAHRLVTSNIKQR
jgi:hypothetical protein